jgi:hypothetical protein
MLFRPGLKPCDYSSESQAAPGVMPERGACDVRTKTRDISCSYMGGYMYATVQTYTCCFPTLLSFPVQVLAADTIHSCNCLHNAAIGWRGMLRGSLPQAAHQAAVVMQHVCTLGDAMDVRQHVTDSRST